LLFSLCYFREIPSHVHTQTFSPPRFPRAPRYYDFLCLGLSPIPPDGPLMVDTCPGPSPIPFLSFPPVCESSPFFKSERARGTPFDVRALRYRPTHEPLQQKHRCFLLFSFGHSCRRLCRSVHTKTVSPSKSHELLSARVYPRALRFVLFPGLFLQLIDYPCSLPSSISFSKRYTFSFIRVTGGFSPLALLWHLVPC